MLKCHLFIISVFNNKKFVSQFIPVPNSGLSLSTWSEDTVVLFISLALYRFISVLYSVQDYLVVEDFLGLSRIKLYILRYIYIREKVD